jgi:hypothetical protein
VSDDEEKFSNLVADVAGKFLSMDADHVPPVAGAVVIKLFFPLVTIALESNICEQSQVPTLIVRPFGKELTLFVSYSGREPTCRAIWPRFYFYGVILFLRAYPY